MDKTSLETLKNRTYEHCQCFDWGIRTFIPDSRVGPEDGSENQCPSCKAQMISVGESHKPYGWLYYCPECRRGWLTQDKYWKHHKHPEGGVQE